ncbi:MAG: hypothetical protein AAGC55_30615, partial [Myxococcota bacterium]
AYRPPGGLAPPGPRPAEASATARAGQPASPADQPGQSTPSRTKRPTPSRDEFAAVLEQLSGNIRAMAKHFERDRRQIYRWIEAFELRGRLAELRGEADRD